MKTLTALPALFGAAVPVAVKPRPVGICAVRPYDTRYLVVCMDEQPKRLIEEVREPVGALDGTVRDGFEYVRLGVCVAWMFVDRWSVGVRWR